jgi:serine/threonine protein kinase
MPGVKEESKIGVGTLLIGKYKVTRELGRGGMAAVYEAEHVNIGKKVAVKVLASELANSAIVIERFFREARAVASVRSPYIVEVYDSGRLEDGRPFIAMELLEGESLYDRMARVRLIDPQTTARIISQVAKGLMKAHAAGIVHRDLKPENIHICKTEDGEEIAKILDFGLAKFYAPVKTDEKTARLTREGAVFGTPAYMSPEQVKGQGSVDHRSDLWALGCMAYECLTGRPVWNTEQGVAMTFAAIAASQLPTPSRMRPDLPQGFDAWFFKALQRDPNNRFQTAKELADSLALALGVAPISFVHLGSNPSQLELEAIARQLEEVPSENVELVDSTQPPAADRTVVTSIRRATPGVDMYPPTVPLSVPHTPGRAVSPGEASEPLELSRHRPPQPSATDLPPTAGPEPPSSQPIRGPGPWRVIVPLTVLAVAGVAAWFVYAKVLHPPGGPTPTTSNTPDVPDAAASSAATVAPPPPELPKWMDPIQDGQKLLTSGDVDGAMRKFTEAAGAGGGLTAKMFVDQVKIGGSTTGPCKLASISHPRLGYGGNIGRPAVAATSKGSVVAWTDDHETPGHDHVYSVQLDANGIPTTRARDLTPEADYAMRPGLLAVDERIVLYYWDKSGREPGIKARWLDADGRLAGMPTAVTTGKAGTWPDVDRAPDGTFWMAWQENPDKEGDDVYVRHLDVELQPLGAAVRATDYEPDKGKSLHVDVPAVAVSGVNLFVAYTLVRDKQRVIERLMDPLAAPDLQVGLGAGGKGVHEIGEATVVSVDKVGGDYPALACAKDTCVLAWHELEKGAQAAMLDPAKGTMLWRKRFAPRGGHPAVATFSDGSAEVAFYEGGRVRVAAISRDGVSTTSTFARVTGDEPRPWIAPGRQHGEWHVAWLDVEANHTEAMVARLQCRN